MSSASSASAGTADSTTEAIKHLQTVSDELEALVSARMRDLKNVFVNRLEDLAAELAAKNEELAAKNEELMAACESTRLLKTELDDSVAMFDDIGPKHFLVVDPYGTDLDLLLQPCMDFVAEDSGEGSSCGELVLATPMNEDWVMVKSGQFLPTNINGDQCLQIQPEKATFAQTVGSVKDQLTWLNTANKKVVADLQELQEQNSCLQVEHSELQAIKDFLQEENSRLQDDHSSLQQDHARLQKWPWFTLRPWRIKEALPPSLWSSVEGAPAEVMCAECLQDSSMWQHIVDLFRTGDNPYQVLSINALHSKDGLKIFEGTLGRLEQRRQEGGIFDTDIGADDPNRKIVIDRLKPHFLRQPPSIKLANVLFVWHGGGSDAIAGITRNGFADLKRTDDGWFGSALYTTTDARYACMYSTGEIDGIAPAGAGPWKVVLAAMAMSHAFPVTRADYPAGQPHCKYKGKPLEPGYYAHAVVVDPEDGYQAAQDPNAPGFKPLEVLAAQEGQLMPLAVVEFQ